MSDIFELASKASEIVECCKIVYGDRRKKIKAKTVGIVESNQKEGEKTLLSTAIRLCNGREDQREVLLILGSVLDSDNK